MRKSGKGHSGYLLNIYYFQELSTHNSVAIADAFLIIANTLPHVRPLASIEPYNPAITQLFSGMVRFFVDAAKFLGRNSTPILQFLHSCLIVHKKLYRSQLVSSAPLTLTMLVLALRATSILRIS